MLAISLQPWFPTAPMLAVAAASHDLTTILTDEVTLSPELHTPPLPATHVRIGYWWQNTRWHPVFTVATATYATFVSHTPPLSRRTRSQCHKVRCYTKHHLASKATLILTQLHWQNQPQSNTGNNKNLAWALGLNGFVRLFLGNETFLLSK